jgi:hypothetical protein
MLIDDIWSLPEHLQAFTIQIEERFVLGLCKNATEPEDADFINHSCNQTAGLKARYF